MRRKDWAQSRVGVTVGAKEAGDLVTCVRRYCCCYYYFRLKQRGALMCADFRLVIGHCRGRSFGLGFKYTIMSPRFNVMTLMSLCIRETTNGRYNAKSFSQSSSLSDYNMMHIKSGCR
jgi:hypothetical protein